jgi:hypothetical protein
MAQRLTKQIFIDRSYSIHEEKYNYDLVKYTNNYTKVEIYCNQCIIFLNKLQHNI